MAPMLRRLRIENLVLIREAELELSTGLNAITGETGAGKTILAQAVGLLLGTKGDESYVGPAGAEAYVEAELDPAGELGELGELRPEGEDALVVSRRVFGGGRTRAYAWGRPAAREDVAAGVAEAAAAAAAALTPEDGDGAAGLVALAERAVAPLERLAPELQRAGDELRDVELRLRETTSELHSFLASLEAEPGHLEELE